MHKLLNVITRTDSYKVSHFAQYPENATRVSSYIEARGGKFRETVFFGLQAFIKEYLLTPITSDDVKMAKKLLEAHGEPFNEADWMIIVNEHDGLLPIEISAVAEGTVLPTGNIQVQVVNTDPRLPWLTSYVETALLRAVWYPSTVATVSRKVKKIIYNGLRITSDNPDAEIPFKLHDFGSRGASCSEAAMLGGMGHLVNFMGTDTVEALIGPIMYYNADGPVGFSIPASEHSTVTAWGRDGEVAMLEHYLDAHPTGMLACVIDSYDAVHFARNIIGGKLRDRIMARDGVFVARPDSGDPVHMPLNIIEILMEQFGYTTNSKGFKVLPPQIRVLQGDGMDIEKITQLVIAAHDHGISGDNFAVGMGGGLLQKIDRDTLKYAMKANAIEIDGVWQDVYKDPMTDHDKKSKKGMQALVKRGFGFKTVRRDSLVVGAHGSEKNYLRPVYKNGKLLVDDTFEAIRERASL